MSRRLLAVAVIALSLVVRAQGAGLLAPTDQTLPPLRVTDHLVDVKIHDQVALTTLDQTFRNDTQRRLEATYVFPLPENAELTDFQMSFNGKMVNGEVLPAERAVQIYESIVRQSKDPGLIEFIGRRLLQMRVFPIEPNSDTKIQVKYQQICRPISGMSGYHYPLRTCKSAMSSGGGSGGSQAYGTMRFALTLDSTAPLKNIWSPTHAVEIVRDGEHNAKIAYEAGRGSLEDDFLLLYDTDSSDLGLSVIAYKPHELVPGHFVLTLTPKQLWSQDQYQPQDVVFVIDTSGSMSSEKIDQAKAALKFCVDKLDERDRFGIVRFSTGFDVLFEELAPATKEKRAEARLWVEKFTAAGGTNITDALKAALEMRPGHAEHNAVPNLEEGVKATLKQLDEREAASGRPFVIVFITDGQGNQPPEETLKIVKQHPASNGARIFSFGVGHDVNTIFLDQLATTQSGKPTYVQPGENLELVLGDFFSVISQPVLTNLKLNLPEIGVTEKFPATLSDLYSGQQLIVAGRFQKPSSGEIRLTAMRNGQPVEFTWPRASFNHTAEANYVPGIWAGRKIAYLIDQIRLHGESKEMLSEVVALAQEHRIQTPYTSWLVNPEQIEVARIRYSRTASGRAAPGAGLGEGVGAAGGARGGTAPTAQRRALETAGAGIDDLALVLDRAESEDDLDIDGTAVDQAAGKAATVLAERNAAMREAKNKDAGGRIHENAMLYRKLGERWYNRIGQFLVDETVDEQTKLTVVKFGTSAYFELVRRCPELRLALAASPDIVVKIDDAHAIVVSQRGGIEEFSAEILEQSGLGAR